MPRSFNRWPLYSGPISSNAAYMACASPVRQPQQVAHDLDGQRALVGHANRLVSVGGSASTVVVEDYSARHKEITAPAVSFGGGRRFLIRTGELTSQSRSHQRRAGTVDERPRSGPSSCLP